MHTDPPHLRRARGAVLAASLSFSLIAPTGCLDDAARYDECGPGAICAGNNARIEASPATISFDATPISEVGTKSVTLENTGEDVLRLSSIKLEENDEDDLDELASSGAWPATAELAPGDSITLEVMWSPRNSTPDTGVIRVMTNDSTARVFEIPIATPALPRSLVLEGAGEPAPGQDYTIDFGTLTEGSTRTRALRLSNSGTEPLEVEGVAVVDGGEVFEVDVASPAGWSLDGVFTLAPGAGAILDVSYTPDDTWPDRAHLMLRTNDPTGATQRVVLLGAGALNRCPMPLARASVVGSDDPPSSLVMARPSETIVFDASGSSDPGGAIARHMWEIIQKPLDSNARLTPNSEDATPRIFLDLTGDYVVELTVVDDVGAPGCEASRVIVQARGD